MVRDGLPGTRIPPMRDHWAVAMAFEGQRQHLLSRLKTLYGRADLLYVGYMLVLASMFLTNRTKLADQLIFLVVLPLALLPLLPFAAPEPRKTGLPDRGILSLDLGRSLVFWAIAAYFVLLSLSAASQPGGASQAAALNFGRACEILLFLLITAGFVRAYPGFLASFFTTASAIAALSAWLNMSWFALTTPIPARPEWYRLHPALGMPEYLNATTISLTYAVYCVGAIATATTGSLSPGRRAVLLASASILGVAVLWTQARSAYIAVAAGMMVLAAATSRWTRVLFWSSLAAAGAVILVSSAARDALLSRGSSLRLETWAGYISMAWERPWLGFGGLSRIDLNVGDKVILHPHNILLAGQIRGGVFAAAALTAVLFGSIYWAFAYWRKGNSIAPMCVIVTVAVAGMLDYELLATHPTWPWVTFWVPIGICIGCEVAARGGFTAPTASAFERSGQPGP